MALLELAITSSTTTHSVRHERKYGFVMMALLFLIAQEFGIGWHFIPENIGHGARVYPRTVDIESHFFRGVYSRIGTAYTGIFMLTINSGLGWITWDLVFEEFDGVSRKNTVFAAVWWLNVCRTMATNKSSSFLYQ